MELKILSKEEVYNLFNNERDEQYSSEKFKYLDLGWNGIGVDKLVVAFNDFNPIGILQIGKSPNDKNLYWMKFVTVHPNFRGIGVARALIEEMLNYLSRIPDAELELSSYEKEGEVLIPMVTELAQNYTMPIRHRRWGDPYQDAKRPYLRKDIKVLIDDPVSGFSGEGTLMFFLEYEKPLQAVVNIGENLDPIKVDIKYLTPKS